ncbi:hypothetical protein [Methylorubrum populi]
MTLAARAYTCALHEKGRVVEQMYKCISTHGGVLYFSENEQSLRSTHDINHPHVVTVTIEGNKAYLSYVNDFGETLYVMPSNFGSAVYGSKELIADAFRIIKISDSYAYFEKNRFYLSSNPDGSVDLKIYMEVYEKFFLASDTCLPLRLLQDNWFSMDRDRIIDRSEIKFISGFRLDFGGVVINLDSLESFAYAHADNECTIIYDGFKIDRIYRYRPLIYLSSFGREQSFTLLNMCIRSIEEHGDYSGDYLIVTNKSEDYIYRLLDFLPQSRVKIAAMPVIDEADMVCARFKVATLPVTQSYQPILYTDTDVICNSSIQEMLTAILRGDEKIYVKAEGDLSLDPYGGYLTSRDDNAHVVPPKIGFSTGVIGFKNATIVAQDFSSIVNCIYSQIQAGTDRHSHQIYDQPVANYYYNKLSTYNVDAIDRFVHGWPPIENEHITGKGLIHFCGGVGPMHKIDRIKSYFGHVMMSGDTGGRL